MSKGSGARPFSVTRSEFSDNWDNIWKKDRMTPKAKDNGEDFGTCGCGRSPTGKCIGWHALTEADFQSKLASYIADEQAEEDK